MKVNMNRKQQGFTLIELVVVIVILGILAVTAAPRFINLQDDAQTATLEGVRAAMSSASALVHSKSLIAGNDDVALADDPTVVINAAGDTVEINFGYPSNVVADWTPLLEMDGNDFTTVQATDTDNLTLIIIYPTGNTLPVLGDWAANGDPTAAANCFTFYYTPTEANDEPAFGTVSCQVPA